MGGLIIGAALLVLFGVAAFLILAGERAAIEAEAEADEAYWRREYDAAVRDGIRPAWRRP